MAVCMCVCVCGWVSLQHVMMQRLPSAMAAFLQANPSAVAEVEWTAGPNDTSVFQQMIVIFASAGARFRACPPVFGVDMAHLTHSFGGFLVVFSAKNSANNVEILGYGVTQRESKESWQWMLQRATKVCAFAECWCCT